MRHMNDTAFGLILSHSMDATQQAITLLTQALDLLTPKSSRIVAPETRQVLTAWMQTHLTQWAPVAQSLPKDATFADPIAFVTLFDLAAKAGHEGVCRWLCRAWNDNHQLQTAHYLSAYHGRKEQLLWISDKFLIDLYTWRKSLSVAVSKHHVELVKVILAKVRKGVKMFPTHDYGLETDNGALVVAASCGHADLVQLLYDEEIIDGETIFQTNALKNAVHNGHVAVIYCLAGIGASTPEALLKCLRADNNAILRDAIACDRSDIVHNLHDMGLTADDARSVLLSAVTCDSFTVLCAVRDMGLTVEDVRVDNNMLLQQAVKQGNQFVVAVLHGMGLNAQDARANGNKALKTAAEKGYAGCARALHKMGLTHEDACADDMVAVRTAIENGHVEIMKVFQKMQLPLECLRGEKYGFPEPWSLCMAAQVGDAAMIQQLRVMGLSAKDARANSCEALRWAVHNDDSVREVVAMGLTRLDVEQANQHMAKMAEKHGLTVRRKFALDVLFP